MRQWDGDEIMRLPRQEKKFPIQPLTFLPAQCSTDYGIKGRTTLSNALRELELMRMDWPTTRCATCQ
jgi:hypothetical protein